MTTGATPPQAAIARPRRPAATIRHAGQRRRLRAVLADRRGGTALVFASSAVAFFGFAALATEGGALYHVQRNARSAADMAAMGGANAYSATGAVAGATAASQTASGRSTAIDTATRNGFTTDGSTTVTVNVPPVSGPNVGTAGAVEVLIRRQQPIYMASMFLLGQREVAVNVRAVAVMVQTAPTCIIGMGQRNSVKITGTFQLTAPDCMIHSNATDGHAVQVGSNAASQMNVLGISAVGGCHQACSASDYLSIGGAPQTGVGVVENPYKDLDTWVPDHTRTWPNNGPAGCMNVPKDGFATGTVIAPGTVFCGGRDFSLASGASLTLPSGTYFFWNVGMDLQQGSLNCSGCAFVFTGRNGAAGQVRINSNGGGAAALNLSPRASNATSTYLDGVSIYRDARADANNGIHINGGQTVYVGGAIVAPTSDVTYNGNSGIGVDCGVLIGGNITMNGTSSLTVGECDQFSTKVPRISVVRMVE